jgi:DNA-binding HxlR family transcriptional regulator
MSPANKDVSAGPLEIPNETNSKAIVYHKFAIKSADQPKHPECLTPDPKFSHANCGCEAREILTLIGDKWSVLVIAILGTGKQRFNELNRSIDGISQRMLTLTLKQLERNGLVTRTVFPTVPPRVEYALTALGRTLLDPVHTFVAWAQQNSTVIKHAQATYDGRLSKPPELEDAEI